MSAAVEGSHLVARGVTPTTDEAAVRLQLERILGSTAFDASTRNRAFLRYVVNETLAGRGDRIKGYAVAQEVFRRPTDFDGHLDPVVRIAATRLRRSLERFYLLEGCRDPLHIDIPKGSYIPSFRIRDIRPGASKDQVCDEPRRPFLIVRPFWSNSDRSEEKAIAAGIAEELIRELVGNEGLIVVVESSGWGRKGPGFILEVGARRRSQVLRVTARLADYGNGRYLGVHSFDHTVRSSDMFEIQEGAARAIALAVSYPGGQIGRLVDRRTEPALLTRMSPGSRSSGLIRSVA